MIEANRTLFAHLDAFCMAKGDPIANAGNSRYIASSNGVEKNRLKNAEFVSGLSFTSAFKIARFDHEQESLFCTVGFDLPDDLSFASAEEVGGGVLTLVLSELLPLPKASTFEIRDVVAAADMSLAGYRGHDGEDIASLFPEVRCFSIEKLDSAETFRVFFLLCLSDERHAELWMDAPLRATLALVAELSPIAIPYQTLCRSIFDTDPSAVFLGLYRCLEALYSYAHATELIVELGLLQTWDRVSEALEATLGWHPREEQSLEKLLKLAVQDDLYAVLAALGSPLPPNADIVATATKRIYLLRNSLVHYRPFHKTVDTSTINWNSLCNAMACLVLHVYGEVYEKPRGGNH